MTNEELLVRCNEKLLGIAPNVTSEDRKVVADELDLNPMTILRYLNGRAKQLDLGIKILELMSARIEARRTLLTA